MRKKKSSVQLVSTPLALRLPQKMNTSAVTLVLASAPSPIDASLVPSVTRHSFGSCQCRLHCLSNYDSSSACSIEAHIGTLRHDRQEIRHYCRQWNVEGMSPFLADVSEFSTASCVHGVTDFRGWDHGRLTYFNQTSAYFCLRYVF